MSDELENIPNLIYSETPLDLRPDLSFYGIEEFERGICEDSFENRSILRTHRLNWQIIYTESGEPSGNIEVLSQEMSSHRSITTAMDRKAILVDDRDPNSDYLTEEALLIEESSDQLAPLWVIGATRTWLRLKEARLKEPKKMPTIVGPPSRCRYIKADAVRCLLWSSGRGTDDNLCRVHLGTKQNNVTGAVAAARRRAYQAAPAAIAIIEQMMESAESEQVKLKAAESILDRAGIRGGVEIDAKVEIETRPAEDVIRERLQRLVPNNPAITELIINTEEDEEDE